MRFPAFMFWPERYWLDTYDLSDAEHGRYLRLMILLWNTPRCRIPNDAAWIAAKTGRSVEAFEAEIKPLLLRFCKTDGRSWWQSKLLAEYERCERLSLRGSRGGKALAQKRKDSRQTPARERQQAHARKSQEANVLESPSDKSLAEKENMVCHPHPHPRIEETPLFPNGNNGANADTALPVENQDPAKAAPNGALPDLEKQLFQRGRQLFGASAGGFIAKLLKAKGGNVSLARAALETAATKDAPREFIGRIINGRPGNVVEGPQWRTNVGPIV